MDEAERKKILARARKARESANELSGHIEYQLVRFNGENAAIDFNVDWSHDTVWATQQQIADLFGKDRDTVGYHIESAFTEGELDRAATTAKFAVVRLEGSRSVSREIEHYNLDVILAVGYGVKSPQASKFRKWATQTLKQYITEGFALNEARLRNDPAALQSLAARVRALRSEEQQVYQAVRECFRIAASDYDKDSPAVRSFYAKLQDRFLYAATRKTASEILLSRADSKKPNMGLTVIKGAIPTKPECLIGKNYLFGDELYVLHILCEQFLLYAESKALRGQSMTMNDLIRKLDELLAINEYPVFPGYKDWLAGKARDHAAMEWHRLMENIQTERMLAARRANLRPPTGQRPPTLL